MSEHVEGTRDSLADGPDTGEVLEAQAQKETHGDPHPISGVDDADAVPANVLEEAAGTVAVELPDDVELTDDEDEEKE